MSPENSEFRKQRSQRALENSEFPEAPLKGTFRDSHMGKPTLDAWILGLADTIMTGGSLLRELRV